MATAIDADYIRTFAAESYIKPARSRGESTVSIPVKGVEAELKKEGLPIGRTPLVCSALRGKKFQQDNKILLDHWDGPPSGQSTTVVFHYRVEGSGKDRTIEETPAARAFRLTEKLRGLLKEEIAAYGGAEGFIRWVRSDEDDPA